jgi:hypothetical protein
MYGIYSRMFAVHTVIHGGVYTVLANSSTYHTAHFHPTLALGASMKLPTGLVPTRGGACAICWLCCACDGVRNKRH